MKQIILLFSSVILFLSVDAQLQLPAFFNDGMVLQQQEKVNIWGKDAPNTSITVRASWGQVATTTSVDNGYWKLQIATPKAGGPHQLQIQGSTAVEIKDVLVGEVWFCSGQSNMEMPLKGFPKDSIEGSATAIAEARYPQIRFFNTKKQAFITLQDNVQGRWQAVSPQTAGESSAVAYFFAQKIHSSLNIPVGIIHSSWGASTVEAWMDESSLKEFKKIAIPTQVPQKDPNRTPTLLYRSMLHPFLGYNIKGVLWYQGEGNRSKPLEYADLFPTMIRSWRTLWGQGDFPFYFVQIAPFEYKDVNAAFLREAQWKTAQSVSNTGMVVTLDLGDKNNIHPAKKRQVGERLANWALHKQYGKKKIPVSGPVFHKMKVNKNGEVIISFKHAKKGLVKKDIAYSVFEIAGADKIFYPAEAKLSDKKASVVVWSNQVKAPVSVRYAFKNYVEPILFNTEGLPAAPFRTDQW